MTQTSLKVSISWQKYLLRPKIFKIFPSWSKTTARNLKCVTTIIWKSSMPEKQSLQVPKITITNSAWAINSSKLFPHKFPSFKSHSPTFYKLPILLKKSSISSVSWSPFADILIGYLCCPKIRWLMNSMTRPSPKIKWNCSKELSILW